MTHLTNNIQELLKELNKDGFNGIRFYTTRIDTLDEKIEDTDFYNHETGEADVEGFENWKRDYVCFVLEPAFPYELDEYTSFDEDKFYFDLIKKIENICQDKITVKHYPNCFQFEVYR